MASPSRATLRRLAEHRNGPVLSVYLDLDPARLGTAAARAEEISVLLSEARSLVDGLGLPHQPTEALRAHIEDAREALTAADPTGVRAVALFRSTGLFEMLRLPEPVQRCVAVEDSAHLSPLARYLATASWCVALVSRRDARVLTGTRDSLIEVLRVGDYVHRRHGQGGWSQARYQRGIGKEIHDHLAHVATLLFEMRSRVPFDHLLLGTTPELFPQIEAALHDYVRRALRGRIDVDVEHATPEEVLRAALPRMLEHERDEERGLLARLEEAIGRHNGRAAATGEQVKQALDSLRVETLLLDDRTPNPDDLVDLALRQSSYVRVIADPAGLEPYEHVAALLRY